LYRQARNQRLLGQPQRASELCRTALQTEDYPVTHHMLAELEFHGEDYFQILARINERRSADVMSAFQVFSTRV
jgi:hypothetical protein